MSTASPTPAASLDLRDLGNALARIVEPERVLSRPIERIAYAADASFYRLIPQAVVLAKSVEEVQGLFRFSRTHRVPMTFRAAGTSLSGQAVTDGILVEAAKHWRQIRVEDEGKRVRVQPGVIGGHVNQALKAYRAKIGPDPASINACMMGGILANNSSGMCCGVTQNAYHTLHSITFVLPSGNCDRHRPSRCRCDLSPAGTAAGAGSAGSPIRDSGESAARRPHPRQVQNEEHHRLFAQRFPGL